MRVDSVSEDHYRLLFRRQLEQLFYTILSVDHDLGLVWSLAEDKYSYMY